MRVFPPPQQSAVVFMLAGVAALVSFQVQDIAGRAQVSPLVMLASAFSSALLWRPVYATLRWTRRRFLVR